APSGSVPYYLYCLRLRRLVLIFVNPLYVFQLFAVLVRTAAFARFRRHCPKWLPASCFIDKKMLSR
ncbi:hypothetical protein, partial [Neisseria meningitidis]